MLVVAKFGGSSLSSEDQFKKVKKIIESDPKRKIVVVSAIGKRTDTDSKITDLLYILHAHLKYGVPYEEIWNSLTSRFIEIKEKLNLKITIEKELEKIKKELNKNINEDYLVSRGEYLTAKLMSSYLGYKFIDAKDVIIFDYNGNVDFNVTENNLKAAFSNNSKIVVPGFYGAYPNGVIKLMTRGGSDITGSIVARSLNVSMYENWTDVSGILMADPRIIKNPEPISEITYTELRELSYMGANVLHEETIFPLQALNIPINIKNTNDADNPGTIITEKCGPSKFPITGIAGKKDFMSITILKNHMSNEVGFLRKTMAVFEKYNISIEHVPSGIDSVGVIISERSVDKCLYDLISELKKELNADDIQIEKELALVAIVGRAMAGSIGLAGRLFSVLGQHKINIRVIAQNPQELNIIVGIKNADYNTAIKAIYQDLVINS